MKGNRLSIALLGLLTASTMMAAEKIETKVIYKWTNNGLVYYSHIKPASVTNAIKLDAQGRKIEDFTDEFDEVVQITVRPKSVKKADKGKNKGAVMSAKEKADLEKTKAEDIRKKNCETARKNMRTIEGGEVYERDSQGNMIRLSPEAIQGKRKNVQRDIDYFCSPASSASPEQ